MWLPSLYLQYTPAPPPPPPPPFYLQYTSDSPPPFLMWPHFVCNGHLPPPPPPPSPPFHSIMCHHVATFHCYIYLWPLPFPSCGNLLSAPPPPSPPATKYTAALYHHTEYTNGKLWLNHSFCGGGHFIEVDA